MSPVRTTVTGVVVAVALIAALAVPLPWYIEAPFLIEPHKVEHVLTPVAGQLAEFPVRPGTKVEQGQLLATLRDIEKEDQYRKLQTSREVQIAEAATLHALEKVSEHALALKRLQGIETQLHEYETQLAELTIRAPIAGQVVAPPRVPPPKLSTTPHLSEWFGDPSQPQNLGCMLQPRTHLLSLAPDGRVQALIYLDQAHRDDLALNSQVEIKFDHMANRTYKARVVEIARQQSEVAPTALSNKLGGGLDSITDAEGHERLTSVAYQARVVLEDETELLKPGMRGNARFLVERRSAALWLWRLFRRTLHFRI